MNTTTMTTVSITASLTAMWAQHHREQARRTVIELDHAACTAGICPDFQTPSDLEELAALAPNVASRFQLRHQIDAMHERLSQEDQP